MQPHKINGFGIFFSCTFFSVFFICINLANFRWGDRGNKFSQYQFGCTPDWEKNTDPAYSWPRGQLYLGIMGDQLSARLIPINTIVLWWMGRFGRALNRAPMMPRDASLSDSCTPDRCSFSVWPATYAKMSVAIQEYSH